MSWVAMCRESNSRFWRSSRSLHSLNDGEHGAEEEQGAEEKR